MWHGEWMRIGYARVSTTEQNLGLQHDDLKPACDASVDVLCAPIRHTDALSGVLKRDTTFIRRLLAVAAKPEPKPAKG